VRPLALEVFAVAAVADQGLVALLELLAQGRDDGRAISRIFLRLMGVAADDVAAIGHHHLLGLERRRRLLAPGWLAHDPVAASPC
jgi:hypothetical protein